MKAGELDIVISTAVAEEGLDVKQCQLVIRFDLPSTLLAFVQSRCATRLSESANSEAAKRTLLLCDSARESGLLHNRRKMVCWIYKSFFPPQVYQVILVCDGTSNLAICQWPLYTRSLTHCCPRQN